MNTIYIGADKNNPLYKFTGQVEIKDLSCVLSHAFSGDELSIDELSLTTLHEAYVRLRFVPSGSSGLKTADGAAFMVYTSTDFLDKLPYATPIWCYADDVLIGKFYSKRVVRNSKVWFDIQAVSAIGVLDGQTHNGGLYAGQTFAEVASDIIGNSVPFTCASDVASLPVFGWLPRATKRSNLHQLLFALGVGVMKDSAGDMVLCFPDTSTVKSVPNERLFLGGSIDYMTPATRVEVAEHAFLRLPSDELVTLYDNTDGFSVADHTIVEFQGNPIHDLEVSGSLVIHESSVNHAVVSGTGVLTGKKYTHTTKIISSDSDNKGQVKTVSVNDATLVSVTNSENVAQRTLSYYSAARTIAADIVLEGEKPGDLIQFTDPFDETARAFVASMDVTSGSFLRAACELVENYAPEWVGNNYSHAVILTGSGTWTVPTATFRAVLIGGGTGGASGGKGEDGTRGDYDGYGSAGAGGVPGAAGSGGKILSVKLTATVGSTISFSCGAGGAGGVCAGIEPTPGAAGSATTFGSYSSASGLEASVGAVNLFTGEVYALPGAADGLAGGRGTDSTNPESDGVVYDGVTYVAGAKGADVAGWKSGYAYGGYGGGAAAGANGEDGTQGHTSSNNGYGFNDAGAGGAGGSAVARTAATQYGCGGNGGHGGGGGGGGGTASGPQGYHSPFGDGGIGGMGGAGGAGADGCVIVYY